MVALQGTRNGRRNSVAAISMGGRRDTIDRTIGRMNSADRSSTG